MVEKQCAKPLADRQPARDANADVLRALSILGVVAIHAGLPFTGPTRFCVPVFVCLFAFYFERGLQVSDSGWRYVVRRLLGLGAPYLFWTAVYVFVFHEISDWRTTPLRTIVGGWLGGYGWPGQYFFIIVFQLALVMPILHGVRRTAILQCLLIAAYGFDICAEASFQHFDLVGRIGDRLFLYWLPYALLGVLLARGAATDRRWLLATPLLLLAPSEMEALSRLGRAGSPYLLVSVMAGSTALFLGGAPARRKTPACAEPQALRPLLRIGRDSLPIYVCNPLIIAAVSGGGRLVFAESHRLAVALAAVVLSVAGGLVVAAAARAAGLGVLVGAPGGIEARRRA
jgi:peptidoglycan/LPS O-acetylase OafA/YrhL